MGYISVSWSPSGASLVFVSQDSCLHYVCGMSGTATGCQKPVSTVYLSTMPYAAVLFLSENTIIAAG